MLTQVDSLGYNCLILYQFAVSLETLRVQSPGQVLIHPLSKQYTMLQPLTHSILSFPRQIMQLQVVRPCGHCLMFYISKNHVPSVKTSTQIDLNITHLKEFININININFYIPDFPPKKINFFLYKQKIMLCEEIC